MYKHQQKAKWITKYSEKHDTTKVEEWLDKFKGLKEKVLVRSTIPSKNDFWKLREKDIPRQRVESITTRPS